MRPVTSIIIITPPADAPNGKSLSRFVFFQFLCYSVFVQFRNWPSSQSSSSPFAAVLTAIQSSTTSGISAAEIDAKIAAAIATHLQSLSSSTHAALSPTSSAGAVAELKTSIQQQRDLVEAEIAQSKEELESKIADLLKRTSAGEARDKKTQAQIDVLKAEHKELMMDLEQRREILEQQARINASAELRAFYRVFQSKVSHVFLALKVIASGMVTREKSTTETVVTAGICVPCLRS